MRYKKLLLKSSPQDMNSDLENYYSYGLYEFSASIAVITQPDGIYNPYYKNRLVYGTRGYFPGDLRTFIENESKKISPEFQYKLNEILKKYDLKFGEKKEFIEENEDYKIDLYSHHCCFPIHRRLYDIPINELAKYKHLIHDFIYNGHELDSWSRVVGNAIKLRDRIVGIWAGIIREKKGIHWENISTLLYWFLERFPESFLKLIGDPDADIIKKQYSRIREIHEIYFEVLRIIFFPIERKNPYWTFWFGEYYIMWISPYLYSNKYYNRIKNKAKKEIQTTKPREFLLNRKIIGFNELKRFFEFCYEKQFSKPPLIIFPNGETFP